MIRKQKLRQRKIWFSEDRMTFAGYEIAKLRTALEVLFGPRRMRGNIDDRLRDACFECASLRAKASELRIHVAGG
jgi:hypothetical protein